MGIRSNGVANDHGNPTVIDGIAALSYVGTFRRLSGGNLPGLTKGALYLLYSNVASGCAGGQNAVWEYAATGSPISTDVDYRIAAVYDGSLGAASRWKMWVDEVAQGMGGSTPGATLAGSSGSNFKTAMHTTSPNDGYIADFKMWNAALTPAEIIQESRSWRPYRKTNLFIWSPYEAANDLKDYSQTGWNATNASATKQQMRQLGHGAPVQVM